MNYEYLWKELEAFATDLRAKGKELPNEVIEDLKSAKTLMTIQNVDPSSTVNPEVEEYLSKTEMALMSNAEYYLGKEYADMWLRRVQEAKARGLRNAPKRKIGFVIGIPKGQDWVRVRITELPNMHDFESISRSLGLSQRKESEDSVIIYGASDKVKAFINQLAERVKKK